VFTTTDTFLAYFGLTSLEELPALDLEFASAEPYRPAPDA
jgi:chromosome segregation and condensation protein ScpB